MKKKGPVLVSFFLISLLLPMSAYAAFDGKSLKVSLNGKPTTAKGQDLGNCPVWVADPAGFAKTSGNPSLLVDFTKDALGDFQGTSIQVNVANEKGIDEVNYYNPEVPNHLAFPIGKETKIEKWSKIIEQMGSLPPGKYYMQVTVNGSKTWDRQCLPIEVAP